jgi:predicted transcriptional regulator
MVDDGPQFADEMVNAEEFEDAEYLLAKQIAEVIKLAEDAHLVVPIPDSARRYVERVFSEWLDDAASVGRARRNLPYIADRSEFETGVILDPEFNWSQGLTLEELNDLYEDLTEDDPEYLLNFPTLHARGPFAAMMDYRSQITDEPLAGHYNRFLPMKVSLRVLLNMILGAETYDEGDYHTEMAPIHIDEFRSKALSVAVYAKKWFAQLDSQAQISVGEEITVGFPDEKGKSQERFVSQFVGSVRKKGEGFLCEMGFIRVDEDGMVEMTREGLEFTRIPNPIIDATPQAKRGIRMSQIEQFTMMRHIQQFLVGEWDFIVEIAGLIHSGSNTPSTMDEKLRESKEWGEARASLMRNGVLSRMQELGFVERLKEGRNITYHLTENGNARLIEGNLWSGAREE